VDNGQGRTFTTKDSLRRTLRLPSWLDQPLQTIMTWLVVTDHHDLINRYRLSISDDCVCWSHNHILFFSFMTFYRFCNKSNKTGANSGAGMAFLSEHLISSLVFNGVHVGQSLVFSLVFGRSLFVFNGVHVGQSLVFSVVLCRSLFVFNGVHVGQPLVFSVVCCWPLFLWLFSVIIIYYYYYNAYW